jgi:hypothetical protein
MKEMSYPAAFLSIFISSLLLFGADHASILLPTKIVAQQIQELQEKLAGPDDLRETQIQREMYFSELKTKLTDFVIAQLDAEPRLDRWELRDQLIRARGAVPAERSEVHDRQPPYVFRQPLLWGPNEVGPVVWAVVYGGDVHEGMGGSRIVVESYVVENGRARLAGRGGSEISDYALNADQIRNPSPNSVSVLIHGILAWSSGHELPAKAVLYDLGLAGVRTTWQTPVLPGLTAHANATGFTITYHDEERHGFPDDRVTETYSTGPKGPVLIGTQRN